MRIAVLRLFMLFVLSAKPGIILSQYAVSDTFSAASALHNAITVYHNYLTPETGLFNGSEYLYNTYYPFQINEGDPFFRSAQFDSGAIFYNNVLYEKVALLFDVIKGEVLTHDPSNNYILRLNNERVKWFSLYGSTFIRLTPDSINNPLLHTGFYEELYKGNTGLYQKLSKFVKENSASAQGINKYVAESSEYFIKKENHYFQAGSKKSLLALFPDRKKELAQFIKKNKLKFRGTTGDSMLRVLTYYDSINSTTTKPVNQ